jgi:mono/diheme cytochrome c family protein
MRVTNIELSRLVRAATVALTALFALPAPGAAQSPRTPAAQTIPPAAMKEADAIYQTRCIGCHGPSGHGDGAVGAMLNPKPRDLADPAWQKSVTDEHVEKIILGGGTAVGKSPLMPANNDLTNKPDVLKALRQMVRDFGNAFPLPPGEGQGEGKK